MKSLKTHLDEKANRYIMKRYRRLDILNQVDVIWTISQLHNLNLDQLKVKTPTHERNIQ